MRPIRAMHALSVILATGLATSAVAEASPDSGGRSLYAQGTDTVTTYYATWAAIPGMQLTLPSATPDARFALVTFNFPAVTTYAAGCDVAVFAGATQYAVLQTEGTLVTRVPLASGPQMLQGEWMLVRPGGGGYCQLSTYYSLSAILVK